MIAPLAVQVRRVREARRPTAVPEPRERGEAHGRHRRHRALAHPPDPGLQQVRPVPAQVRRQHTAASARRLRRQQGPHHCRRVQGDARAHLRPHGQRAPEVQLLQVLGVPQRRLLLVGPGPRGDLHQRQQGPLHQGSLELFHALMR